MKKKMELDGVEAAWELHLAEAWRAAGETEAGVGAESEALARRLDEALRLERAARRARRRSVWAVWTAAAACAALLAWGTARWAGSGGAGGGAVEVAEEAAAEEEYELAEAREAPVAEAFEELDDMLWEMASVTLSYEWDDEDLESIN